MGNLDVMFGDHYRDKRILVTGHTGFKGSWLALWLKTLGAEVSGISLAPDATRSHWELLDLDMGSCLVDIRDRKSLLETVRQCNPQIVFHLAAQALVRPSYEHPLETWTTNVAGTANLLEACRQLEDLSAIVVVTTDKVYENLEQERSFRENDRLGGNDPYSASKASVELLTASYRNSFFNAPQSPLLATVRGGNVHGGGDWSKDRLVPDMVRAIETGASLHVRSPTATRPWQHVLDCLSGYLLLGQHLLKRDASCASAWNFGPDGESSRQVREVLESFVCVWPGLRWSPDENPQPQESHALHLDCSLSHNILNWRPVLTFEESIEATATWYREWLQNKVAISREQLSSYTDLAANRNLCWAAGGSV